MSDSKKIQILDRDQIRRALSRIAHEICERNRGAKDLVLIGLMDRGDILAQRLADAIGKIESVTPLVGALDITFYRDDTSQRNDRQQGPKPTRLPFDLENKCVILVDDVLFTGRSIRAAMDELIDYGRPRAIQLAVLVDRGHRELPIHADYVGQPIVTTYQEKVVVLLQERDQQDAVYMISESGRG